MIALDTTSSHIFDIFVGIPVMLFILALGFLAIMLQAFGIPGGKVLGQWCNACCNWMDENITHRDS